MSFPDLHIITSVSETPLSVLTQPVVWMFGLRSKLQRAQLSERELRLTESYAEIQHEAPAEHLSIPRISAIHVRPAIGSCSCRRQV